MKKQSDGRYRNKIKVGDGPDGKPIYKYASGRTKKELAESIEELRRIHITGNTEVRRDILFSVYVQEWYEAYKRNALSESSKANYSTAINRHLLPVFGNRQMRAIRAVELQTFMNSKSGMGKTAIGDMHSILVNVFTRASAQGIVDRNPSEGLKKPSVKTETRRPLTDIETAATLSVARSHPDGLLLLLLYYTGLRRGEVLGLQWQDIDFGENLIHVRRDMDFVTGQLGSLKSTSSERDVPMPDELTEALNAVRGIGATPVIQSPRAHIHWGRATFVRHWKALTIALYNANPLIEAEIIGNTKDEVTGQEQPVYASVLTPHYFRHNYASILYNAGVDVLSAQKMLGHSDPKTTLTIYTHLGKRKEDTSRAAVVNAFAEVAENLKVAGKLPDA